VFGIHHRSDEVTDYPRDQLDRLGCVRGRYLSFASDRLFHDPDRSVFVSCGHGSVRSALIVVRFTMQSRSDRVDEVRSSLTVVSVARPLRRGGGVAAMAAFEKE
jgi:hypothetical protein